MRVRGDISPEIIHIEDYSPVEGYVEIRLRENIREVTEKPPVIDDTIPPSERGEDITRFEYDEYVLQIPARDGLREEIEANLSDWIITGRTLEVNHGASIVQDMLAALEILGVSE